MRSVRRCGRRSASSEAWLNARAAGRLGGLGARDHSRQGHCVRLYADASLVGLRMGPPSQREGDRGWAHGYCDHAALRRTALAFEPPKAKAFTIATETG